MTILNLLYIKHVIKKLFNKNNEKSDIVFNFFKYLQIWQKILISQTPDSILGSTVTPDKGTNLKRVHTGKNNNCLCL